MSKHQYSAYFSRFRFRSALLQGNCTLFQAIWARRISIATVRIHIPCRDLHLIINVYFLTIPDDIASLPPMKDIVDNCLDINIQDQSVSLVDEGHPSRMVIYFWIHQWYPTDMPFALYTKGELIKIHLNFVHATRHVTEGIL